MCCPTWFLRLCPGGVLKPPSPGYAPHGQSNILPIASFYLMVVFSWWRQFCWPFDCGGGFLEGRSIHLVPIPIIHFRIWAILIVTGRVVLAAFVAGDWGDFLVLPLPGCVVYCWNRVLNGRHIHCLYRGVSSHPHMIGARPAFTFKYVLPCILLFYASIVSEFPCLFRCLSWIVGSLLVLFPFSRSVLWPRLRG